MAIRQRLDGGFGLSNFENPFIRSKKSFLKISHVGIQNLTSELTKPMKKTELKSEPPKLRKRPKCVKIHSFFRRGLLDHILDVFSAWVARISISSFLLA